MSTYIRRWIEEEKVFSLVGRERCGVCGSVNIRNIINLINEINIIFKFIFIIDKKYWEFVDFKYLAVNYVFISPTMYIIDIIVSLPYWTQILSPQQQSQSDIKTLFTYYSTDNSSI